MRQKPPVACWDWLRFVVAAAVASLLLAAETRAADAPAPDGEDLNPKGMGRFVAALCQDLDGNLWVGTEDTGVWRYSPSGVAGQRWTQFTRAKTGGRPELIGPIIPKRDADAACLGDDNACALACDARGRVWVGHLNHGVSVFNGRQWRNYGLLSGPLGERVFSIKTSPADGDVWIATNVGIARFRINGNSWTYYTRADGLPADDIQCLAFDGKGTLYAGTQCDGLAISAPVRVPVEKGAPASGPHDEGGAPTTLEYRQWRVVSAPGVLQGRPPAAPCGDGLPTNLLSDVLVARDGTVYAATPAGLAAGHDSGRTWTFLRGQDWEERTRGFYRPPAEEQIAAAARLARDRTLLLEDYVTCLAEDDAGNLWLGHREKGFEVLDPRSGQRVVAPGPAAGGRDPQTHAKPCDYVTAFLGHRSGVMAATYGTGLARLRPGVAGGLPGGAARTAPAIPPPLPPPAARPSLGDVNAMLARLAKLPVVAPEQQPPVVALPDDWQTQGDWLGRYGRYWACCCAICSPQDYLWGAGREPVEYVARIGPHQRNNDSLRYWVHWLATDNRCSLEMPPIYLHSRVVKGYSPWNKPRRQAEWCDHSQAYPRTWEGPDIYCTLKIPAGPYILSLYDFNKDGHEGSNRSRDFPVSIRGRDPRLRLEIIDGFEQQPELARARIHDFWGGVWKRFLVQGPTELTVRVARNGSFCTILAGVMLDPLDEEAEPYFPAKSEKEPVPSGTGGELAAAVRAVLGRLADLQRGDPARWAASARPQYVALLRATQTAAPGRNLPPDLVDLVATCEYHCNLFPDWEREQTARGLTTARATEKSLHWDGVQEMSGRGREAVVSALGTGSPVEGDAVRCEIAEGHRLLGDRRAVHDVAEFDLGSIRDNDAARWAVLRITPDQASGDFLPPEYHQPGKGLAAPKDQSRSGTITKGEWELLGSLAPSPAARRKGGYDWLERGMARWSGELSGDYYPLYHGGFVLAQHDPEKAGEEQFGTLVVLPEDTAKWAAAAYEFRRKNADLFGEPLKEEQLLKLLGDESPMIAIMAAQRLARSKPLAGAALGAALGGPADSRRAVALYLAFAGRGQDGVYDDGSNGAARVAPEIAAAIKKADAKMLRLYAVAISVVDSGKALLTTSGRAALKLCREQARTLPLDQKLRGELSDIFAKADLPPLDANGR
jgi:hypothetical protein